MCRDHLRHLCHAMPPSSGVGEHRRDIIEQDSWLGKIRHGADMIFKIHVTVRLIGENGKGAAHYSRLVMVAMTVGRRFFGNAECGIRLRGVSSKQRIRDVDGTGTRVD